MFIGYKNFCAKFIGIPDRFRSQLKSPDTSSFTACIAKLYYIMSQTALTATMKTAATGMQSPNSFLPGPTGELNARSTFAKPPILCAGPGKKAAETQAKAVTALGGVAVKATGQIRAEHLTDLTRLGAVIWWGDGPTARMFDLALAARAGPIVALITGQPDSAHVLFEQHVCIDTTAAGGNAALLRGDS